MPDKWKDFSPQREPTTEKLETPGTRLRVHSPDRVGSGTHVAGVQSRRRTVVPTRRRWLFPEQGDVCGAERGIERDAA